MSRPEEQRMSKTSTSTRQRQKKHVLITQRATREKVHVSATNRILTDPRSVQKSKARQISAKDANRAAQTGSLPKCTAAPTNLRSFQDAVSTSYNAETQYQKNANTLMKSPVPRRVACTVQHIPTQSASVEPLYTPTAAEPTAPPRNADSNAVFATDTTFAGGTMRFSQYSCSIAGQLSIFH